MVDRLQEYKNRMTGGNSYKKSSTQAPPKSSTTSSSQQKRGASKPAPAPDMNDAMDSGEPVAFKILSVGNQEVGKS